MSWPWFVIGYVLMWIITGCLKCKFDGDDPETATSVGMFWPIFLPMMVIKLIVEKITDLIWKL